MGEILLSAIAFCPLLVAFGLLAIPGKKINVFRWVALAACLFQLLMVCGLAVQFDIEYQANSIEESFQFVEKVQWFQLSLGTAGFFQVDYFMGVDGISLPLLFLSCFLLVIGVISSWNQAKQVKGYFVLYLLLATAITGCFLALDFFLFYLFFELLLLPMFFLIGIWGGKNRAYASIKFFIYTLVGSLLILIVMIGLYTSVTETGQEGMHTFNLLKMMSPSSYIPGSFLAYDSSFLIFGLPARTVAFFALLIGFIIKLPGVPFHTWLPDAHVEAPTAISVILAGLLLKVGAYGLIRIAYPIFPDIASDWTFTIALLGVVSIVYGGLGALAQKDFKRLVAYSSVSHMGFVLLGVAALTTEGWSGSFFHMISHGLISGALFLLVGVLYDRTGDRKIENFSGLASKLPAYTFLLVIVFFASLGLPGLSGFVGEFLVLLGAFSNTATIGSIPLGLAITATIGVLVSAIYYLWTLQRMFFGQYWVREKEWEKRMDDLSVREYLMLVPLVVLIILLGVWPRLILDVSENTIQLWLDHMSSISPKP